MTDRVRITSRPGWIASNKDPLGILEKEYVPRMGYDDAVWGLREELKH